MIFMTLFAAGALPFAFGWIRLGRARDEGSADWREILSAALLCALAFNLIFFWQELWLVLSKAAVPGLHPVLYHNDHDWAGNAPIAELLEGSGAVATLMLGLFCSSLLALPGFSQGGRRFLFWMALQGLIQASTQLFIGALLPGNDVGRALAYLGADDWFRHAALAAALAVMAGAGLWLAPAAPRLGRGIDGPSRRYALELLLCTTLATVLVIPFRVPKDAIEVAVVPALVNFIAAGWLVFGVARRRLRGRPDEAPPSLLVPAAGLLVLLAFFQGVLRDGVPL